MTQTQHTLGPWTTGRGEFADQILSADDELICDTGGNVANARLIAEAPAMRDFIESIASRRFVPGNVFVEARALLARIDGRQS